MKSLPEAAGSAPNGLCCSFLWQSSIGRWGFRMGVYHALPQLGLQGVLTLLFSLALGGLLCLATTLCSPAPTVSSPVCDSVSHLFICLSCCTAGSTTLSPTWGKGGGLSRPFAQPRQLGGAVMDCIFPMIASLLPMLSSLLCRPVFPDFTPALLARPGGYSGLDAAVSRRRTGSPLSAGLGCSPGRLSVRLSRRPAAGREEAVSAFGLLTALRLQLKDLGAFPGR